MTEIIVDRSNVLGRRLAGAFAWSVLVANVERKLGVASTSRNWRTVCKLLGILDELD